MKTIEKAWPLYFIYLPVVTNEINDKVGLGFLDQLSYLTPEKGFHIHKCYIRIEQDETLTIVTVPPLNIYNLRTFQAKLSKLYQLKPARLIVYKVERLFVINMRLNETL